MLEKGSDRGASGKRPVYLDYVGKDTFYVWLASLRGQLFRDGRFRRDLLSGQWTGPRAAPPAGHGAVVADLRQGERRPRKARPTATSGGKWRWGLRLRIDPSPRVRWQMFRAPLILHDKVREVFEPSRRLARQSGYLKKRGMRVRWTRPASWDGAR